jgi:hypothetical protein
MKILLLLGYVSGINRPFRFPNLLETRTVLTSSGNAGVTGMCSRADDGFGRLSPASSSGITELDQCAQYAKENAPAAEYISFSSVQNACIWFTACPCIASGSTCLGGSDWLSIAVSDVIKTSTAVVQTGPPPGALSAIVKQSSESSSTTASPTDDAECDTSSSDLMQYFQSKCAMSDNMWISRIIALSMAVLVLLIFGAGFSVAFWLDREELAKLYPEETPVAQ